MSAIPADAEERFQRFLEQTVPYYAVVEAAGDAPWFNDIEERRELYFRRWTRPAPPADMSAPKSLTEINQGAA